MESIALKLIGVLVVIRFCDAFVLPGLCFRRCSQLAAIVFRGRGIPYVENRGEQKLRLVWESQSFRTAETLINRTLLLRNETEPLFRKRGQLSIVDRTLFSPLFGIPPGKSRVCQGSGKESCRKKQSFALTIAYRGSDFCGWQTQPNNHDLPSVQKTLEQHLEQIEGNRVDLRVCGRTDAGVSAVGQICRYRTKLADATPSSIIGHLDGLVTKGVRCLQAKQVSAKFHPSFGASCRAYAYIIDLDGELTVMMTDEEVMLVNDMLQELEGHRLDFVGLSYGNSKKQTTDCTLLYARAAILEDHSALCIQLVGDRFLRRMVRLLVSTVLQLALEKAPRGRIREIVDRQDRKLAATAAPAKGLIFVGAEFQGTTNA